MGESSRALFKIVEDESGFVMGRLVRLLVVVVSSLAVSTGLMTGGVNPAVAASSSPSLSSAAFDTRAPSVRGEVSRGVVVSGVRLSSNGRTVAARVSWDRQLARAAGRKRAVIRVVAVTGGGNVTVAYSKIRSKVSTKVQRITIRVSTARARILRQASRVVVSATQLWGPKKRASRSATRAFSSARAWTRVYVGTGYAKGKRLGKNCGSRIIRPGRNLSGCDLTGAYLGQANLTRVNFTGASLRGGVLSNARIAGTKFKNAKLTGVRASGTSGRPASLPKGWSDNGGSLKPPKPGPGPKPTPPKSVQTVTFGEAPDGIVVGLAGTGTVSAMVTAPVTGGGAITYTSTTLAACTVNAHTGVVTGVAAGSDNCTIKATAAAVAGWQAGSATQTFSIGRGPAQTVTFGSAPTVMIGSTGTVVATSNGDGSITYTSNTTNACTVNPSTGVVTGIATDQGVCTIQATAAPTQNWSAGTNTQTFSILPPLSGSLDKSFATAVGTGFDASVSAVAVQDDGKTIVGGSFSSFDGTSVGRIARLNDDGSLDTGFATNSGNGFDTAASVVAVQNDGKILVGGNFSSFDGTPVGRIARLNDDGSLDTSFATNSGTGFSWIVDAVAVQDDGKILVGGQFTSFDGTPVGRIARLNDDGSLDTSFATNSGTGFSIAVDGIAVQDDDKIVVAGAFTSFDGTPVGRIARLNDDGSLDTSFATNSGSGFSSSTYAVAIQDDGKIVVAGAFSSYDGASAKYLARLNADGTLDTDFVPSGTGFNAPVSEVVVHEEGQMVVIGNFSSFDGTSVGRIARLNADGSLDAGFATASGTGFSLTVRSMTTQNDGTIIVGGDFTSYDGTSAGRIARINNSFAGSSCGAGGECSVGDTGPGGGTVIYVADTPQSWGTYIEAANDEVSPAIGNKAWGIDPSGGSGPCSVSDVSGASATGIGDGKANTAAILVDCPAGAAPAAKAATDYNGGGFGDWYLPSKDEMNLVCLLANNASDAQISDQDTCDSLGTYSASGYYWTSSQADADYAFTPYLADGTFYVGFKYYSMSVWPVRAFG